jgi:tetratricopeptide (TPR) repeat protein
MGEIITDSANRNAADELTSVEAERLLRKVLGNERVTAESGAVRDLIAVCARSPLALRIVAFHIAAHADVTVVDITDPHHRQDTSNGNEGRHGPVPTVVDWAYTRLPADQAHTLRRLGAHPSPEFDLHAAAAVAEVELATARHRLEALADVGLIDRVGDRRYRLHDVAHRYAAQRAERDDTLEDQRRARTAALTWYAHIARAADRLLFPGLRFLDVELAPVDTAVVLDDRSQAMAWLRDEQANLMAALRAAVQHDLYGVAVALAGTARFLALCDRSLWTVRAEAETLGLTAARANRDRATEAFLLGFRGETLADLDKFDEAEADFTVQLDIARDLHDPSQQQFGLCGLGQVRFKQERYLDAEQFYLQALPLARRGSDRRPEAVVECNLSQICIRLGHYDQALIHAERELVLRRESPDRVGEAYALHDVAVALQGLGDHAAAIERADDAVTMYRALGSTDPHLAAALETAAISLQHTGDPVSAAEYLQEALTIFTNLGTPVSRDMHDRLLALEISEGGDTGQ